MGGGPEVEVGYVVKRALWREGYATEMATAMISLGFHALPVDSIVSFTYPDNTGSRRVMEKCGLTYEREIQHVGRDHVLYRITRDEHRNGPLVRVVHGEYVVE